MKFSLDLECGPTAADHAKKEKRTVQGATNNSRRFVLVVKDNVAPQRANDNDNDDSAKVECDVSSNKRPGLEGLPSPKPYIAPALMSKCRMNERNDSGLSAKKRKHDEIVASDPLGTILPGLKVPRLELASISDDGPDRAPFHSPRKTDHQSFFGSPSLFGIPPGFHSMLSHDINRGQLPWDRTGLDRTPLFSFGSSGITEPPTSIFGSATGTTLGGIPPRYPSTSRAITRRHQAWHRPGLDPTPLFSCGSSVTTENQNFFGSAPRCRTPPGFQSLNQDNTHLQKSLDSNGLDRTPLFYFGSSGEMEQHNMFGSAPLFGGAPRCGTPPGFPSMSQDIPRVLESSSNLGLDRTPSPQGCVWKPFQESQWSPWSHASSPSIDTTTKSVKKKEEETVANRKIRSKSDQMKGLVESTKKPKPPVVGALSSTGQAKKASNGTVKQRPPLQKLLESQSYQLNRAAYDNSKLLSMVSKLQDGLRTKDKEIARLHGQITDLELIVKNNEVAASLKKAPSSRQSMQKGGVSSTPNTQATPSTPNTQARSVPTTTKRITRSMTRHN